MLFEITGAVAITVVLGYLFLMALAMAIPPLIGFDEFHIPAGLALLSVAACFAAAWWFIVGVHIHVTFG